MSAEVTDAAARSLRNRGAKLIADNIGLTRSPQEAQVRSQAAMNDASYLTRASADTNALALNGILSAHQLVEVTGAGKINSGSHFLSFVTHAIDPSTNKMRLEMMRNAAGAVS